MCYTSIILHAKKGKRARFERLHSSWNPELSASLAKRMKLDRNQRVAAATGALTGVSQLWRSGFGPFVVPKNSACNVRGVGPATPLPVLVWSAERMGVISTAVPTNKT